MWQEPRYDEHQFGGGYKRTTAHRDKNDHPFSHVAASDFMKGMHIERHKVQRDRRLPTPDWAVNDQQLRELLLTYCENRFYLRPDSTLNPEQRMERIRKEELSRVGGLVEKMHDLQARYKPGRGIQIQNRDTQIVIARKSGIMAMTGAVVYLYYRTGCSSKEVAEQLGLKAPHVRALLWRLSWLAKNGRGVGYQAPVYGIRNEFREKLRAMKINQRVFERVKRIVENKHRGRKWTKDRFLYVHFCLLRGKSFEQIAPRIGQQHSHSVRAAYRYFLKWPDRLAA
jgi:hypothetical protein